MPTPVDKVPVTWLEFLEATPPACRRTSTEKPERTHAPSASSLATCGATTTLTFDNDIRSTLLADHTRDWLATQKIEIIPEEDYTQPLHNEQGVAELYVHTVLSRVKQALDILLADLLKHKDLAKAKYCFNIRPQQGSPTRSNNTRCDHFLVLEHYDGIAEDTPPPKSIIWRDPKKIAEMLQARVEWESDISDMKGEAPAYPCLVLCVVEEKAQRAARERLPPRLSNDCCALVE
ncbi:hypothetical protein C8F01DRAFT_546226 [Mycena amicta]|nr:hypothetical protein C8F01DRAFT_546226 [Mycena amicta]